MASAFAETTIPALSAERLGGNISTFISKSVAVEKTSWEAKMEENFLNWQKIGQHKVIVAWSGEMNVNCSYTWHSF